MLDPFVILAPLLLLPVVGLLRFIGCTPFDEAVSVIITITPATAILGPGQSIQFTAAANGLDPTKVDWSSNAPMGFYTAKDPRNPSVMTDTVKASTKEAGFTTGEATVTLKAVTVVVTPPVVSLKAGEKQQFTATVQPSANPNVTWTNAVNGLFTAPTPYVMGAAPVIITATANADASAKGTAIVNLIGTVVRFVSTDAATKGDWKGVYGSAGWGLAAMPANLVSRPAFVSSLNLPAVPVFTYGDPTADVRGLQRPPMFLDRFAAVWFDAASVQIEFEIIGLTHRVAVYFVDWDLQGRIQKVEILDGSAPATVLDTRNLSGFTGGQYLIWDVSGKVILRATKTAGQNAVIGGIFFE